MSNLTEKQQEIAKERLAEQVNGLIRAGVDVQPLLEGYMKQQTKEELTVLLISEITVKSRFRKDLGDVASLVRSIREVGLLHPVVVNEHKELIAGERRLEACKQLGWVEVPVRIINLEEIVRGEWHENLVRKDFTPSEMDAIRRALEPKISETRIGHRPSEEEDKGADSSPFPKGKTRELVAVYVGVSHDTVRKIEKIVQAAETNPEKYSGLLTRVDSGSTSINHAYNMIQRNERAVHTPPMPEGLFQILYADPPWQYRVLLEGNPDEQYPTMSLDNIAALQVPAGDDAILFLWAPNPKLEDALQVMKAWGFEYKTNMVWVKNRLGLGFYVRGKHELLLIGTKGKLGVPDESNRPPSIIVADQSNHSAKPEVTYEIIESMYPNHKQRCELFARNRREGWVSWGNEIQEPSQ